MNARILDTSPPYVYNQLRRQLYASRDSYHREELVIGQKLQAARHHLPRQGQPRGQHYERHGSVVLAARSRGEAKRL